DTDVNGQTMLESPTQHRQMKLFSSKERRKSTHPKNDPYWVIQTITKSGKLERKVDLIDGKKKTGLRSWRIYGVILSGSQLMFFKDETVFTTQMKKLKNLEESAILPVLKPDVILMTADSVA
ncbi:6308_t:CDS:2, partial [Dentiscutata erythropus]